MDRRVALLGVLAVLYVGWGLAYIHRTTIDVEVTPGQTQRVHTLWDDGMISMTYARNLARGHGLRWNVEEDPVQGFTNLGVTLLMALLHLLPMDVWTASLPVQLMNLCVLLGVFWATHRFARALSPADPVVAGVTVVVVALYAPLSIWTLQGSDAGFTTGVAVWALALVASRWHTGAPFRLGLWFVLALGVVVRPDMILVYAVFLAACLAWSRNRWRDLLVGFVPLAVTVAGLGALGVLYYGDPLPNTFYLKTTGVPRRLVLEAGWRDLVLMTGSAGLALLAISGAAIALLLRRERPAMLAAATSVAFLVYNVWVGGDWLSFEYHSRFVVPAVVIYIALFVAAGDRAIVRWVGGSGARRARGRAALVAAAAASLLAFRSPPAVREFWFAKPTMYHAKNEENIATAAYLASHTAPDTSVALHWAGAIAYFSERPPIDVLGKSDRHIARLQVDRFAAGHSKWDWRYTLREQRPDVIVRTSRGLDRRTGFADLYAAVEGTGGVSFAMRKESLWKLRDPDARVLEIGRPGGRR